MTKKQTNQKELIAEINQLLISYFGIPKKNKKTPTPLTALIGTILSQNTNDNNSFQAYKNLRSRFRNWSELQNVPVKEIEKTISVAGLGNQKAKAIKNIISVLTKESKRPTLNKLYNLSDEEAMNFLTEFQGVGKKTASCVLLFSMGRNVCPVDTHLHRILNRIGVVNTNTPDKTFDAIKGNIPANSAHSFHTNLIKLGREICFAGKPHCFECPLIAVCKYKQKNMTPIARKRKEIVLLLDTL